MSNFRRRFMMLSKESSAFPSGYTRLQYVDNQGAAYCSTGILVSGDMTFDLRICVYQSYSNTHYMIAGGGEGNFNQTRNAVGLRCLTGNSLRAVYRLQQSGSTTLTTNEWYNLSLKSDGFYKDETLFQSVTRTTFRATFGRFYLGSYYSNVVTHTPHFQLIGDCKINDIDFIPAKRDSDDAVGFLNMSTEVFLISNSDTPFLAGPNY